MRPKTIRPLVTLLLLGVTLSSGWRPGQAQTPSPAGATAPIGNNFTYQGRLQNGGLPYEGECDFQFSLFASAGDSDQVGSTVERLAVSVEDGYFSVPDLDFGAGAFTGEARWLAAAVRCPAGSGSYEALSPRQALTAAPAALSLRLPFMAEANLGGPLAWFENDGDGEAAGFSSAGGAAVWVDHAGTQGVYVNAAAQDGVYVATAGDDGVHIDSASGDGLYVYSATANGAVLGNVGVDGVAVGAAGDDGFQVYLAGSPSASAASDAHNGFEVAGAQGSGLSVGRADLDGAYVSSAGYRGFAVGSAGTTGAYIGVAGEDGVYVHQVGSASTTTPSELHNGFEVAGVEGNGLYVGQADGYGVYIVSTFEDGVKVIQAGPAAKGVYNRESDGFDVGSTHGNGLFVGWSDLDGVNVASAGQNGISVGTASWNGVAVELAAQNGFEVENAQGHGLYVDWANDTGVYVQSAGWNGMAVDFAGGDGMRATGTTYNALYGDTANAQGEWGVYTPDKLHAQNVTMQSLTLIAQVSGSQALYPGDIVAAAGVGEALPGSRLALPQVQLANGGGSVLGVVEAHLALTSIPGPDGLDASERDPELRSVDGPINPGDYVALTVFGVAQVKIDLAARDVQPGTRLTGSEAGYARPLKTVIVDGVTLAESVPTIGIALSVPDEHGMVWVLVNPQ